MLTPAQMHRLVQNEVAESLGVPTGKARELVDALPESDRQQVESSCLECSPAGRARIKQIMIDAMQRAAYAARDAASESEPMDSEPQGASPGSDAVDPDVSFNAEPETQSQATADPPADDAPAKKPAKPKRKPRAKKQ